MARRCGRVVRRHSTVNGAGAAMSSPLRAELAPPPARDAGAGPPRTARRRADEPDLVGRDHGLDAVAQAELDEHVADVGLHRRLADDEAVGDLGVGRPRATSSRTCRSRGVRTSRARPPAAGRGRRRAKSSISRRRRRRRQQGVAGGHDLDRPSSSARGASLSRKPLAPARSASNTYSSRSNVVRTMTRGASVAPRSGWPRCRRATASARPSARRRGRSARPGETAAAPSPASPTTSTPLGLEDRPQAGCARAPGRRRPEHPPR